jgi:hypothetical protein
VILTAGAGIALHGIEAELVVGILEADQRLLGAHRHDLARLAHALTGGDETKNERAQGAARALPANPVHATDPPPHRQWSKRSGVIYLKL